MTCENCGREHQNTRGICPFCNAPHRLRKRYKRDSAERQAAAKNARLLEEIDRNFRVAKQQKTP